MKRSLHFVLAATLVACGDSADHGSDATPPALDGGALTDAASQNDAPPQAQCSFGAPLASQWIDVRPGSYQVGSPVDESCRDDDEAQRTITLVHGYSISAHETTQAHFAALMGYNPSFEADCSDCPVESVSWHEAANYCNALSAAEGMPSCYSCTGCGEATRCEIEGDVVSCAGYRLPTEAEWEIAARAGSDSAFYSGPVASASSLCMGTDSTLGTIGWYKVNSTGFPHPVGQKTANGWGLFDMAGNVYEWVNDWYAVDPGGDATDPPGPASGNERVLRGGAWYFNAHHARSANRERFRPDKRFNFVGFRCVLGK